MLLTSPWRPRLDAGTASPSVRLTQALATDIATGVIPPGARLPPHRELADTLKLALGTVTKAYLALGRRGLVQSVHGRGTFVAGASTRPAQEIDLSINVPPQQLSDRLLAASLRDLARRLDAESFGSYLPVGGRARHRELFAQWLGGQGLRTSAEDLLLCHGAQHALSIALAVACRPGGTVLTEAWSYPGAIRLARHRRQRLVGLEVDAEGLRPSALAAALKQRRGKKETVVLYTTPTLQNPIGATMGERRRREIAALCRAHGATIVEDDVYSIFAAARLPKFASLLPDQTLHVTGLSKCLSPGLRAGCLVAPPTWRESAREELQATSTSASLLSCLVMEVWLSDGTAAAVAQSIREEASRRATLAADLVPGLAGARRGQAQGFHVWLPLDLTQANVLAARCAADGIRVPAPQSFLTDRRQQSSGLRLSLGGPGLPELEDALRRLAVYLTAAPRDRRRSSGDG